MANNPDIYKLRLLPLPLLGIVGGFGHNARTHTQHARARASTHYWAESAESEPTTSVWHGKYSERFAALEAILRNVSMYRSATR